MLLVCEQVKELGVQYKLLQEVAGRTLIVDIAIQREGARPVALQVESAALARSLMSPTAPGRVKRGSHFSSLGLHRAALPPS